MSAVDAITFLGCLVLAFPVVMAAFIAHVTFTDWCERRRYDRGRLPTTAASNVTILPRERRPFDWEDA